MTELILYGFPQSTYTRTARLVCEEKGVDYTLEPAPVGDPERYARLHPYRKMPVLRHGEVTVFETLALSAYVDQVFAGPVLQPTGPVPRAEMLQWISACNDVVDADVVRAYVKAGAGAGRAERVQAVARLGPLDRRLSGRDWLAGDALTLADLFLAPMIAYALQRVGDGLFDSLPDLRAWFGRIDERDSMRVTRP